MARTIITSNTIFFVLILFILMIFFYNVFHFSNRLQCAKLMSEKDSEVELLKAQLAQAQHYTCTVDDDSSHDDKAAHGDEERDDWKGGKEDDASSSRDEVTTTSFQVTPPPTPTQAPKGGNPNEVIPILVVACDRTDYLERTLGYLLQYRPSKRFPIYVSQGCGNGNVNSLLNTKFGNKVVALEHHRKEGAPGYFAIAQHYGWALTQIFTVMSYDAVIIVEDDMEISPDFYEYFAALYPILHNDRSLYCVSSWNDNGMAENVRDPKAISRTDVFPGLGWMMTRHLWNEVESRWPDQYWDEFMRQKDVRNGRQCLFPEISRNKNIGERGTSERQFWDKISRIKFNTEKVNFTGMDLSYLYKQNFDKKFLAQIEKAKIINEHDVVNYENADLRIIYTSIPDYANLARMFSIMDDEKEGMPRTSYKGVVSFYHKTNRIFLTPENIK